MAYMVVTLDVSKLSGWLNADAFCRVGGTCYEAKRGAGKEMRDVGQLSAAQPFCRGRADWGLGAGHARPHIKHGVHICDARRAQTQRLVER